jgi:antitoxin HicB
VDRLTFPARIDDNRLQDSEDWGYTISFRDLPEAITYAASVQEAELRAVDCLWTTLAHRMRVGEAIPAPSRPEPEERMVTIDDLLAAKAALYASMREQGMSTADLSRRLNIQEREAASLVDPASRPPIARLQRALAAVGKRLVFDVRDAA